MNDERFLEDALYAQAWIERRVGILEYDLDFAPDQLQLVVAQFGQVDYPLALTVGQHVAPEQDGAGGWISQAG